MINDASADRRTITGNYFEDFSLGQQIVHATPRTVTVGDVSLLLRASRNTDGSERVYRIEVEGFDRSGNTARRTVNVTVR